MSSSSSFFRVSRGTKHPYSPESAHLPGYEPAMLNFGVVLAVFFGATALVGAGTWTRTAGEPREFFFFFSFFEMWITRVLPVEEAFSFCNRKDAIKKSSFFSN